MSELELFAKRYSLTQTDGVYAGICEDMYVNLLCAVGALELRIYLDLPKAGSKRAQLLGDMNEKAARYEGVTVEYHAQYPYFLIVRVADGEGAAQTLSRYLLECDVLLRAYGRELGVLCEKCRCEIKEGLHSFSHDSVVTPLCTPCALGDSQDARGQRPNRQMDIRAKRRKGALGALLGALAAALFWAALVYLGLGSVFIPAIGVAFIVNLGYVRLGGSIDPKRLLIVCVFTVFAVFAGEMLGELIRGVVEYNQFGGVIPDGIDELTGIPTYHAISMGEYIQTYVFGKAAFVPMIYDFAVGALFGVIGAFIVAGRRGRR